MRLIEDYINYCLHNGVPNTARHLKVPKTTGNMQTFRKLHGAIGLLEADEQELLLMRYAGDLHSFQIADNVLRGKPLFKRKGKILLRYTIEQIKKAYDAYQVNKDMTLEQIENKLAVILFKINEHMQTD